VCVDADDCILRSLDSQVQKILDYGVDRLVSNDIVMISSDEWEEHGFLLDVVEMIEISAPRQLCSTVHLSQILYLHSVS
jgi:hypothetical protein